MEKNTAAQATFSFFSSHLVLGLSSMIGMLKIDCGCRSGLFL
jgi:hypothetical protein